MINIKPLSPKALRFLDKCLEEKARCMGEHIQNVANEDAAADACNDLAEVHSLRKHIARSNISELTLKEFRISVQALLEGIAALGEKLQSKASEDEKSDLSNDLGLLSAVLSDFKKSEGWSAAFG